MLIEEEEEEEIVAKIPSCSLTCEIVDFCRVCNQNLWRRKKESKIRLRRRLKVMKKKKQKDKVENDTQSYDHRVQRQENESECQVRERKKKKTFSASSKCVANDLFSFFSFAATGDAKRSELTVVSTLRLDLSITITTFFATFFSLLCLTVSIRSRSRGRQSIGF